MSVISFFRTFFAVLKTAFHFFALVFGRKPAFSLSLPSWVVFGPALVPPDPRFRIFWDSSAGALQGFPKKWKKLVLN